MLNKNQSKKRNSWKYYVVIPALAAFVFLFQIEVIAKEKREATKETAKQIVKEGDKSIDVYKIKKTTTDQELKEIAEKLKLHYNVDFKVSGLERNSSNELTAIKVDVKRGSEETQAFSIAGNKGIKDCGVIIITEEDGSIKISLITDNKVGDAKKTDKAHKVEKIKKVVTNTNTNNNTNVNTNTITSTKTNNDTNDNTNVSVTSTVNGNVIVSTTNTDTQSNVATGSVIHSNIKVNGNALYIIDGVVVTDVDVKDIAPNTIKSVSVFKGPEAIVKYGEKGKDGVIVIETKK